MTSNPASVGPAPDGEWIEWSGGENPVPGQTVQVRFRDGAESTSEGVESDVYVWTRTRTKRSGDIIAYRIAPHPDREAEPASDGPQLCNVCDGFVPTWGVKVCQCEYHAPAGTYPAEPTGGVSDLEQRAFHAANQPQSVECYQQLVRDLWRAVCEAEALSVSPPVVEGALRASPCVPTEEQEPAVVGDSPLEVAYRCLERVAHAATEMTGTPVDSEAANAWALTLQVVADDARATLCALQVGEGHGTDDIVAYRLSAVSTAEQPGIFALRENEPKDRHQPTTPGEQEVFPRRVVVKPERLMIPGEQGEEGA